MSLLCNYLLDGLQLMSLFNVPYSVLVSGSDWAEVYWTSRSARAGQQLCITSRSISINPIDCAEEWNCSCHSEITSPFDGSVPIPNQSLQNCYNTQGNFCLIFVLVIHRTKGVTYKEHAEAVNCLVADYF